ncbi:MAG: hypothetical protein R3258_02245 [Acidimicrobiia bacterium]|nr:hypothetical protein [Acidimicrobiia bacterium]
MSSFDARLRRPGHLGSPLGVVVDLTDTDLTVRLDGTELAAWSLDEISISPESDGFHVRSMGEEVILDIANRSGFAIELGSIDFLGRWRDAPG